MKQYLYHGSVISGIQKLKAISKLHGVDDIRGVYLSENIPYSLFYIWDAEHNKRAGKYVTCGLRDGIVYYEEQFPDQLRTFYSGVSGYLYCVEQDEGFARVKDHEAMWFSDKDVSVAVTQSISDVYEEILKYEQLGKVKVIRYEQADPDRIRDLYEHIAERLAREGLTESPESKEAVFYQTYFEPVWNMAVKKYKFKE